MQPLNQKQVSIRDSLLNSSQTMMANFSLNPDISHGSSVSFIPAGTVTTEMLMQILPYGRFQICRFLAFLFTMISTSHIIYNMALFLLMPHITCDSADCSRLSVCSDRSIHYSNDYSNVYTIDNWISQLNLFCSSNIYVGLFGSVYFFGML